jgi:hypothetical protein
MGSGKDPRAIMALACLIVCSLLWSSDFSPRTVSSFNELNGIDGRVELICVIISEKPAKGGTMLQIEDVTGSTLKAYCKNGTYEMNTTLPCTARIIGTVQKTSPGIIFAEGVVLQEISSQGKINYPLRPDLPR